MCKSSVFQLFALTLAMTWLTESAAFVENVIHGYQSCRACHLSPAGGGVLTEYGRSLARELMSTWGHEGLEDAGFGLIKESETFRVGGDLRAIQTYLNNYQMDKSRFFKMQQNIELAFKTANAWWVGTLGTKEGPTEAPDRGQFLSERHYVLIDAAENVTVRVGKYRINFGLNDPNHTRATKQSFGFGSLSETYNLEVGFHNSGDELFLTASLGNFDKPHQSRSENSFSISYGKYVGEKSKWGTSFLIGETDLARRDLLGLWGVTAFGEKGLFLGEVDYQESTALTSARVKTARLGGQMRLGLNVTKGVMPYALYERLHLDMADSDTLTTASGLGVQFLPLPHLELQTEYQHQTDQPVRGKSSNSIFILIHFYL